MIGYLFVGVVALVVALGVFANSRWAARHGWVYNRHNPRPEGVGLSPGAFDQIYQPSMEHVIEEETSERTRADQDESGEGFGPPLVPPEA